MTHGYLEVFCFVSKCSVLLRRLFPGALFIGSKLAFLTIPFICTYASCQFLQNIFGDMIGIKKTQGTHPHVIPGTPESLACLPSSLYLLASYVCFCILCPGMRNGESYIDSNFLWELSLKISIGLFWEFHTSCVFSDTNCCVAFSLNGAKRFGKYNNTWK